MEINATGQMPPPLKKPNAEEISSKVFSNLDSDGDGSISSSELEQVQGKTDGILAADVDHNGSITEGELVEKIRSLLQDLEANQPPQPHPGENERLQRPPIEEGGLKGLPPQGEEKADLMERLQQNGSDDALQLLSILQNTGVDRLA